MGELNIGDGHVAKEEVKDDQIEVEEPTLDDGDETPEDPSPSDETDIETDDSEEETPEEEPEEDVADIDDSETVGLQSQKEKLKKEITDLRGVRRDLKGEKITTSQPKEVFAEKEDDLSDVSKEDIKLIDRVIRSKGYVQKDELSKMTHQEKIDEFTDQ